MYSKTYTTVKKSGLHGKGLFACQSISEGTVIGRIKGKPARKDGAYVLWLTSHKGFRVVCRLKYINHSYTPNAVYCDNGEVVALSDIAPDEEITHHYGWG
ncbi:MAG TPA: SET domain-containing protein [Chromatiaceae bacterium]|jgi:SET domain-containing protein|nr:SET domain-containing protein [Chromatiaceae bacterium]HIN81734.1 SET domain-containing protein [Chromatiales bacterium]HIA07849.1 SET domain-containing protein [Chromatiaceae bacterium]HIB84459.1 SET domain-containing protein [Chromatiaceae bacterium]HIO14894.1 SET domain-containing protein [Chromatiales bacterium]